MIKKEIAMISMPTVSKKFSIFNFRCEHCIALFTLIVLAVVSVVGLAVAQQGFALIGTWQQVQKDSVQTVVFNPDETFYGTMDVAPGAGGTGSGRTQWRGVYRATGASSWVAEVQFFQMCASGGGCSSCPPSRGELPGGNGCALAQYMGLTPGTRHEQGWQMQGPNQGVDQGRNTWRRIR
jgi:hypothetical protein